MTNFIRGKERSRHIPFFPIVPQEEGKDQSQTGRGKNKRLFSQDNWSGLYCFIREKENPPSQLASSKLCTEYFQGKVTVYNMSFKDNYFCHLFWNLSSGIWFKTWIPKKENYVYWLFFFFPPWTLDSYTQCSLFKKKNPYPLHSNLIIHSFHKLVYSHRYGQVLFWARKL